MDYLADQIKFHEGIIQVHTLQLNNLKKCLGSACKIDKEISPQTSENKRDLADYETKDLNSLLAFDNDLIWNRIRNAHVHVNNDIQNDINNVGIESDILNEPIVKKNMLDQNILKENTLRENNSNQKTIKENNLQVAFSDIKLSNEIEPDLHNTINDTNTTPRITKLSQFTQKKQNEIIKNIFIKATENMNNLAKLDLNILNNLDESIRNEADRLLTIYLDDR
jgi:hypothetical protein